MYAIIIIKQIIRRNGRHTWMIAACETLANPAPFNVKSYENMHLNRDYFFFFGEQTYKYIMNDAHVLYIYVAVGIQYCIDCVFI